MDFFSQLEIEVEDFEGFCQKVDDFDNMISVATDRSV